MSPFIPRYAPVPGVFRQMQLSFLAVFCALACAAASAGEREGSIRIAYGSAEIAGATTELGLRTTLLRRENFNAHGFDVLFVHSSDSPEVPAAQGLVPFFGEDGETAHLSTREGADCLLRDFRLKLTPDAEPVVVVAERELGESYIAQGPIRFREFELRRNAERIPGRPALYFEESRSWQSEHSYCDVGEALQRELGLGDRR